MGGYENADDADSKDFQGFIIITLCASVFSLSVVSFKKFLCVPPYLCVVYSSPHLYPLLSKPIIPITLPTTVSTSSVRSVGLL